MKNYIEIHLTWCWHRKFGFVECYHHQVHELLDMWTEEWPPINIRTRNNRNHIS